MYRQHGEFPIPESTSASLAIVVAGSLAGAMAPWELVRHVGWAVVAIGLASLIVGLARVLWLTMAENRVQFMSRVAREMIESLTVDDLDHYPERINEEEKT